MKTDELLRRIEADIVPGLPNGGAKSLRDILLEIVNMAASNAEEDRKAIELLRAASRTALAAVPQVDALTARVDGLERILGETLSALRVHREALADLRSASMPPLPSPPVSSSPVDDASSPPPVMAALISRLRSIASARKEDVNG